MKPGHSRAHDSQEEIALIRALVQKTRVGERTAQHSSRISDTGFTRVTECGGPYPQRAVKCGSARFARCAAPIKRRNAASETNHSAQQHSKAEPQDSKSRQGRIRVPECQRPRMRRMTFAHRSHGAGVERRPTRPHPAIAPVPGDDSPGCDPDQRLVLALSASDFFPVMARYFILRPIHDQMGVAGGVKYLPWLFSIALDLDHRFCPT